ncbi:hypothetical protein DB42_EC00280 [Neochlamydia sp. EPS4]|nr:hypothetical protein DB42_EC00280 [Neochlamydia sp. EPS4]
MGPLLLKKQQALKAVLYFLRFKGAAKKLLLFLLNRLFILSFKIIS